jgi:hypothetical protein
MGKNDDFRADLLKAELMKLGFTPVQESWNRENRFKRNGVVACFYTTQFGVVTRIVGAAPPEGKHVFRMVNPDRAGWAERIAAVVSAQATVVQEWEAMGQAKSRAAVAKYQDRLSLLLDLSGSEVLYGYDPPEEVSDRQGPLFELQIGPCRVNLVLSPTGSERASFRISGEVGEDSAKFKALFHLLGGLK